MSVLFARSRSSGGVVCIATCSAVVLELGSLYSFVKGFSANIQYQLFVSTQVWMILEIQISLVFLCVFSFLPNLLVGTLLPVMFFS